MAKNQADLLTQIEEGAHDPATDLPSLLRRCISLGAATGTADLRQWASLELKGYGPDDALPDYREIAAPLLIDGATYGTRFQGQMLPRGLLPAEIMEHLSPLAFPQPIATIVEMMDGDGPVRLGPPGHADLTALMNHNLAANDTSMSYQLRRQPAQMIERIYWNIDRAPLRGIVDTVQTTVVELVAEMRAGTPAGAGLPSNELAAQAVDVAINGNRNRITIASAPGGSAAAGGTRGTVAAAEPESAGRRWMYWAAGFAGIIAMVAGIAAVWFVVFPTH